MQKECLQCNKTFDAVGNAMHCKDCMYVACPQCGEIYKRRYRSKSTYCSGKCFGLAQRHNRIEMICQWCGKSMYLRPADVERGRGKFCSRICIAKSNWSHPEYREKTVKSMKDNPIHQSVERRNQLDEIRKLRGPIREETREMIRQARLRQTLPTKMTSIEQALHDEFKERSLDFIMHKTMFGRFQPDFVFEDEHLIVQADGEYWHSLPRNKACDIRFNEMAAQHGWKVLRFTESVIRASAAQCADIVETHLYQCHSANSTL